MALGVARDWYRSTPLGNGITRIHEIHVAEWLRCNIWHVCGRDRDLIIDTGMGLRSLTEEIAVLSERPQLAVMTHSHFDHSGGLHQFDVRCGHEAEAAIIASPSVSNTLADSDFVRAETFTALPWHGFSYEEFHVRPAPLTRLLDEGDIIDLGDRIFHICHLPGHSPGSIALYERETGTLFSGDVVYDGDLIDNLFHSDPEVLRESHARLRELPISVVHPGHFNSFDQNRLIEILDDYKNGGRRLVDADAWLKEKMLESAGGEKYRSE